MMLKISKIDGRVWVKVFDSNCLVYSDGDFDTIGEAMATAADYLKSISIYS